MTCLREDIKNLAAAVVQVYKTLNDCLTGGYPHYTHKEGDKIYPVVVTLENWRLLGSVMCDLLERSVSAQMDKAGFSQDLIRQFHIQFGLLMSLRSVYKSCNQ